MLFEINSLERSTYSPLEEHFWSGWQKTDLSLECSEEFAGLEHHAEQVQLRFYLRKKAGYDFSSIMQNAVLHLKIRSLFRSVE